MVIIIALTYRIFFLLQIRRKSFEEKRRKHYNEFEAVRKMRERMGNMKDGDDDIDMDE